MGCPGSAAVLPSVAVPPRGTSGRSPKSRAAAPSPQRELLLRKLAIAMLAVPDAGCRLWRHGAATLGDRSRQRGDRPRRRGRPRRHRLRPARAHRPPRRRATIVPLTQAAFRTSVGTGGDLDAAGRRSVQRRRWTCVGRRPPLVVDPPTAVELHWNADDTTLTDRAGRRTGRGHVPHHHREAGRAGRQRPAAGRAGPGGVPHARPRRPRSRCRRRCRRQAGRPRDGASRSTSIAPSSLDRRPRHPARPADAGPLLTGRATAGDGRPRFTFTPLSRARGPNTGYR